MEGGRGHVAAVSFDLTEMSALKEGVVQEWGLKSLFAVSALAA